MRAYSVDLKVILDNQRASKEPESKQPLLVVAIEPFIQMGTTCQEKKLKKIVAAMRRKRLSIIWGCAH